MKEPIKRLLMGDTTFLGGKNFGKTIDADKANIVEDIEQNMYFITHNDEVLEAPRGLVYAIRGVKKKDIKVVAPEPHTITQPTRKIKAQVGGPTDHVFQGEGHGISRNK